MRRSMPEKIEKAMVNGLFFRTTWRYLLLKAKEYMNPENWLMNISRWWLCKTTPVKKNKILFHTFQGDYTCNPKYITEELIKRNLDVDIVWALRNASIMTPDGIPHNIRLVEQYSYEYFKELASAKIWIVNSVEFLKKKCIKKNNQFLIETWHGSLGIKRFSKDVNAGKGWVKAAEKCGKWANYCISNSTFEDNIYRETFWKNTPILQYGHPRNDILVLSDIKKISALKSKICEEYNIPAENKLVLYAPTFRDDHRFDYYDIDIDRLLIELKKRFGGEWTFLTRYHPTVRKWAKKYTDKFARNETDVTLYTDIQELIAVADIAITDYSSWIYDFVLTKRPGFIFAVDEKKYYSERGFYYPLEQTPFPVARNNRELLDNIKNFDQNNYLIKVNDFLKSKGCMEDGNASKRVVDKIIEIFSQNQ